MIPKAVHRVIKVKRLGIKAALILKQEMLSRVVRQLLQGSRRINRRRDRCSADGHPAAV